MKTADMRPFLAPSHPSHTRIGCTVLSGFFGIFAGLLIVLLLQPSPLSGHVSNSVDSVAVRSAMRVTQAAQRPSVPPTTDPRSVLEPQVAATPFRPKGLSATPPAAPVPIVFSASSFVMVGALVAAVFLTWGAWGLSTPLGNRAVAMAAVQSTKGDEYRREGTKGAAEKETADPDDGSSRGTIGSLRSRVNGLFGRRLAELEAFRADPFSLADELLADVQAEFQDFRAAKGGAWYPSVDVQETPERIVVHCDLPGIPKESIQIDLTRDRLVISGKREQQATDRTDGWQYAERSFGLFSRSFAVPPGTTRKDVTAAYKDGVLEVIVKKQPPPVEKDTRIPIQ
eukprot:TRINITY_DN2778_c0_g1_i1.p1 TRINITY_DN2778_c0_g1~~TRINITY_DN2778_c0_g1_i1.p1  ORF type:complete len:353 (-),score=35.24 TRINITY_DN2778_c0_g1_i1:213-1235(-)